MIKLKNIIHESLGATDIILIEQRWKENQSNIIYRITYQSGKEVKFHIQEMLNKLEIDNEPPFVDKETGKLTEKGYNEVKHRVKMAYTDTEKWDDYVITDIRDIRTIQQNDKIWKYYTDYDMDEAYLEELNWKKDEAIEYNIEIWNKAKEYSEDLQTWWEGRTTDGSEANKLFNTPGVQGFWNDVEEKARDLWWNTSKTGNRLFRRLKKLYEKEISNYLLSPKTSAILPIMDAMEKIKKEITEVRNDDVEWQIEHPITKELAMYLVDPEIDT